MTALAERPALPVLTSLRFFAATAVVLHHQRLDFDSDFLNGLTKSGYDAVTFFFVLSGFILTYVYSAPDGKFANSEETLAFWRARFVRIAPAYYLGLALLLPRFVYSALGSRIVPVDQLIMGLILVPIFQQSWWPPAAQLWNTPAWSLSVEFFFYLLFPAVMTMCATWPPRQFFVATIAMVVAAAYARFELLPGAEESLALHGFVWFSPTVHLPQFVFGIALARLFLGRRPASIKISALMFYLGVVAVVLTRGRWTQDLPNWLKLPALVGCFGLIIVGGARAHVAPLLATPLLVLLGEASYSMYILHSPIGFWWEWSVRHLPWEFGPWVSFMLYFGLIVGTSIACFLWVESPIRRRFRLRKQARRAAA